MDFITFSQTEQ